MTQLQNNITKAGYVAIIGKPNAGKSTLMNALIGENLSIVTYKPQTTRKKVLGILTENNIQIVFIDTPGILTPKYAMQAAMMEYVQNSINEADCILYIYDITKYNPQNPLPSDFLNFIQNIHKPVILLLNKIDLLNDRKDVLPVISALSDKNIFSEIVPVSALKQQNSQSIANTIAKYLPESPFYYDADMLSNQPERFFVSEIIRKNIFLAYSDEIPYSTEVNILEFKEREFGKWYINSEIIIEKQSQKGIIIGKNGNKLKQIAERARIEIEQHLKIPVYLEIFVKVRNNWRNDPNMLRSFGY